MHKGFSVVFVADVPQTGGASACLVEVIERLVLDWGVRCTVLLPTKGPLESLLNKAGATTIITGHRSFLVSRPNAAVKVIPKFFVELIRYFICRRRALRKANQLVDFATVDLIHSNLPRNDLGIMLSEMHHIPHVCHLREFSFDDFHCWSYRRRPGEYLSEHSDCLLAVSNSCGNAWVKRGVDSKKLVVAYDGVNIQECRPALNDGSGEQLSVVFLGGYSKAKGLSDALMAIKILRDRGIRGISLDVFGIGSRLDIARARKTVDRLGISSQVSLNGMVPNVAQGLSSYDVGLVCSRSEAFGRVVIEYLASGVVVVAANKGSLPELLGNGEFGLLYEKDEGPTSLADSLHSLFIDRGQLRKFQNIGLERAGQFTVERNVTQIVSVYEKLSGSSE